MFTFFPRLISPSSIGKYVPVVNNTPYLAQKGTQLYENIAPA